MPKMYVCTIDYTKYAFFGNDAFMAMDVLSRARPVSRENWNDPYLLGETKPLVTSVELADCREPTALQEDPVAEVDQQVQPPPPAKDPDDDLPF